MSESPFLIKGREVGKLPVVTIDGGEDAAEIKDVVYDASRHHLIGFTLNKRGWFRGTLKAVLTADNVVGIGADAVMVESDSVLSESTGSGESLGSSDASFDVIGNDVVSSDGTVLGQVVDVILETGPNPSAVGYEVDTGDQSLYVPSSAQMSVSGTNLIVPAEADEYIRNDLAGFGGAVATFRDRLDSGSGNGGTA